MAVIAHPNGVGIRMGGVRRDRRELAFLGALVLGWGLVFAPLAHQLLTHSEGHGHSHGPAVPDDAPHGQGTLEHGAALLHPSPAVPALLLVLVAPAVPAVETFEAPTRAAWPKVEQPQGP